MVPADNDIVVTPDENDKTADQLALSLSILLYVTAGIALCITFCCCFYRNRTVHPMTAPGCRRGQQPRKSWCDFSKLWRWRAGARTRNREVRPDDAIELDDRTGRTRFSENVKRDESLEMPDAVHHASPVEARQFV